MLFRSKVEGEKRTGVRPCQNPLWAANWRCREILSLLEGAKAKTPPGDVVTHAGLIQKELAEALDAIPWKLKRSASEAALDGFGGKDNWPPETPSRIQASHDVTCESFEEELNKGEPLIQEIRAILKNWMDQAGIAL